MDLKITAKLEHETEKNENLIIKNKNYGRMFRK